MPLIELQFPNNTGVIPSLQVGDIAFYASGTNISDTGGFNNFSLSEQNLVTIGTITSVSTTSGTIEIICNVSSDTTPPTTTDFILMRLVKFLVDLVIFLILSLEYKIK